MIPLILGVAGLVVFLESCAGSRSQLRSESDDGRKPWIDNPPPGNYVGNGCSNMERAAGGKAKMDAQIHILEAVCPTTITGAKGFLESHLTGTVGIRTVDTYVEDCTTANGEDGKRVFVLVTPTTPVGCANGVSYTWNKSESVWELSKPTKK